MNRPFKKYFRLSESASFSRRLFLSFLLIAIPVIAGVSIAAFSIISLSSKDTVSQSQATALAKTAAQLESILGDTENLSRELLYNPAVQDYLLQANDTDSYPADSEAAYYVNSLIINRDYIDSLVLMTPQRTVYSTENAYSDRSAYQNIIQKWWFERLSDPNMSYAWFPYARLEKTIYESQKNNEIPRQINTLMLARPITDMTDYRSVLGYLMIYLDDEYLEQLWHNISWGRTTNVFVFNEDSELIMSNSRLVDYSSVLEATGFPQTDQVLEYKGEQYVISSAGIHDGDWQIFMVTPYKEVNSNAAIMTSTLFVLVTAILFALFIISRTSANIMARPIIALSKRMDSYHGSDSQTDPRKIVRYQNRTDEIGRMYRSYDQLEDRMNRLIQEIYVKNLEKKDAELALLQSQINPHFLYNTLDSINWIALANGQDEISEMITALSDTFRLSLMKNNSSFVEMDQEIQYIQSYLVLQKFRYADRLSYDFDIPDPIPKLYIPRFILQPVVENALKHGISKLENGGLLMIRVTVKEDLFLYVINDGSDIDLEKMDSLLVFDPADSDILNFKPDGYGVQNIHRRIKIYCGDKYGLSYSKTGTQTICQITLPVKETL